MDIQEISSFVVPLIIAITLHEAAHGYVANSLGDNTAKRMGRVTFNPLRHIDLFGTLILPGIMLLSHAPGLFGYAKPVPVNFRQLRHLRRDTILVAAAGPMMNLSLAFISALLIHLDHWITPEQTPWLFMNLYNSVTVNVILCVFNLLPILPLDGGRVLNSLLPRALASYHIKTERYGILVVLLIFMLPAFLRDAQLPAFNIGYYLIWLPADAVRDVVYHIAGIGNDG